MYSVSFVLPSLTMALKFVSQIGQAIMSSVFGASILKVFPHSEHFAIMSSPALVVGCHVVEAGGCLFYVGEHASGDVVYPVLFLHVKVCFFGCYGFFV